MEMDSNSMDIEKRTMSIYTLARRSLSFVIHSFCFNSIASVFIILLSSLSIYRVNDVIALLFVDQCSSAEIHLGKSRTAKRVHRVFLFFKSERDGRRTSLHVDFGDECGGISLLFDTSLSGRDRPFDLCGIAMLRAHLVGIVHDSSIVESAHQEIVTQRQWAIEKVILYADDGEWQWQIRNEQRRVELDRSITKRTELPLDHGETTEQVEFR